MISLAELSNKFRPKKKVQRVGRGEGSGRGKTSCRGNKGDKSRSGYKRRAGNEGGQLPLYRKLPCRGFDHGRFHKETLAVSFEIIEALFKDGDTVNYETLRQKGYAPRRLPGGIKILSNGKLTKKVTIEAHRFSEKAKKELEGLSIPYKIIPIKIEVAKKTI
jgi:large subunit ribosomal protein L15